MHHERPSAPGHRRFDALHEDRSFRVRHTCAPHDGPRRWIHDERIRGQEEACGDHNVRSCGQSHRGHVSDGREGRHRYGYGRNHHRYRNHKERQAQAGARGRHDRRHQDESHGRGDLDIGDRGRQSHLRRQRRCKALSVKSRADMFRRDEMAVSEVFHLRIGRRCPPYQGCAGREHDGPRLRVLQDPPHAVGHRGFLSDRDGSAQGSGWRSHKPQRGGKEAGCTPVHAQRSQIGGLGPSAEGRIHADRCPPCRRRLLRIRQERIPAGRGIPFQRNRHVSGGLCRQMQGGYQGEVVQGADAGADVRGMRLLQAGSCRCRSPVEGNIRRKRRVLLLDRRVQTHHRYRGSG